MNVERLNEGAANANSEYGNRISMDVADITEEWIKYRIIVYEYWQVAMAISVLKNWLYTSSVFKLTSIIFYSLHVYGYHICNCSRLLVS